MTKMTKKEYFIEIMNYLKASKDAKLQDYINFLQKEIDGLDRKTAAARAKAERTRADADALTDALADVVPDTFTTIPDIIALLNLPEVTPAKATYRLNALVADGILEKGKMEVNKKEYVVYKHC